MQISYLYVTHIRQSISCTMSIVLYNFYAYKMKLIREVTLKCEVQYCEHNPSNIALTTGKPSTLPEDAGLVTLQQRAISRRQMLCAD